MSTQVLSTQAQRIGRLKAEILEHVIPQEIIGKVCRSMKKAIPKNSSETVVFRRWLPKGATTNTPNTWTVDPTTHRLNEGETPSSDTIQAQDITVSLEEYGLIYRFSNRVEELYEDEVPSEMKRQLGERMGLLLEQIRYGKLKAATNVYRAGNVASRSLVTALLSTNVLANVARGLFANLAPKVTSILSPSAMIGTTSVEAAYVVVCSGDLEQDIRNLTGFTHVSDYGSRKVIHDNELGSWQQFRFVISPHMAPYLNAGTTATASTRLAAGVANTAGSELVDVYPMLVLTEDAYGDVMLRGIDGWKATFKPAGTDSSDDPLGQRGYVAARTYFSVVRLNELHMAVVEVACSSL